MNPPTSGGRHRNFGAKDPAASRPSPALRLERRQRCTCSRAGNFRHTAAPSPAHRPPRIPATAQVTLPDPPQPVAFSGLNISGEGGVLLAEALPAHCTGYVIALEGVGDANTMLASRQRWRESALPDVCGDPELR